MGIIYHTPNNASRIVASISDLNSLQVNGGDIVTVTDVGFGKYATFLFPTTGSGSQNNRTLVSTNQAMTVTDFNSTKSGDMSVSGSEYIVHSQTFTAPIGARFADVSAWAVVADETNNRNDAQLVKMWFTATDTTNSSTVFSPSARPRTTISSTSDTSPDLVDKRSALLSMSDTPMFVFEGRNYRFDVRMEKKFSTGPTYFVEGLIKVHWRT